MTARAVVTAFHADGFVDLEIATPARCAGCAGMCTWRRLPERVRLRLPATGSARVGTDVLVALPERYVLLSALLLHGLPWGALLAGAALGAYAVPGDVGAIAGAVLAALASVLLTPALRRRVEKTTLERLRLQSLP
jgi:positive regulator of sigma E activity